jgi:hypothetical protein
VLFDYLEDGQSVDDFVRHYPSVSREQAVAALDESRNASRRPRRPHADRRRRGHPEGVGPLFGAPGVVVEHIEDIGLKGTKNGALLAAGSGSCDSFVRSRHPRPAATLT